MAKISSSRQSDHIRSRRAEMVSFWRPGLASAAMLVLLFLLGGSARADVPLLVGLRPAAAIMLAYALWRIGPAGLRFVNVPLLIILSFTVLCAVHLLPLPPAIWQAFPDRGLIVDITNTLDQSDAWRPLTVSPTATWNALLSTVPILALILLVGLERERYHALLPLLLIISILGMVVGALQIASPPGGALYPYRFSSFGSPIGFFANRNHQAVFLACMIPTAFGWSVLVRAKNVRRVVLFAAVTNSALALLFLAMIGSRAGLLLGALGAGFSLWLVHRFGGGLGQFGRKIWLSVGALALALGMATMFVGRGESVSRIAETSYENEERLRFWKPIVDQGVDNFPVGTGLGSFVEAYLTKEDDRFLQPNYLNHAHNDWIEAFMTGGLPMLLILVAAIMFVVARIPALLRADRDDGAAILAWVGVAWLGLLAIASVFDYPLRTPAMSGVAAIGLIWINAFRLSQKPVDALLDGMD